MKKLAIILIIFSNYTYAQNEVEELQNVKKEILEKIEVLNDSIKSIDYSIAKMKSKEFNKLINDSSIVARATKYAELKKTPEKDGETILTLKEYKEVTITDYNYPFFSVCTDSICGYMEDTWFLSEKMKNLAITMHEEKYRQTKNKNRSDEIALEKSHIKKYGSKTYSKLKEGRRWIGMTKEMAIIAYGYPNSDNKSVGSWVVHNQWVYDNMNLYFEDGVLTSWQD